MSDQMSTDCFLCHQKFNLVKRKVSRGRKKNFASCNSLLSVPLHTASLQVSFVMVKVYVNVYCVVTDLVVGYSVMTAQNVE